MREGCTTCTISSLAFYNSFEFFSLLQYKMSRHGRGRVPLLQTDPVDRDLRPFFGDEICRFMSNKCQNIDLVAVSRMAPKTSTDVLRVCLSIDEQTIEGFHDGSESPQHIDKIFKLLKRWKESQPSGRHTLKNLVLCLIHLKDGNLMEKLKDYLSESICPNTGIIFNSIPVVQN